MKSLSAFERISFDLLVDAAIDSLDGDFESMSVEEREQYLVDQAKLCAPLLRITIAGFTQEGLESVADWRARNSS